MTSENGKHISSVQSGNSHNIVENEVATSNDHKDLDPVTFLNRVLDGSIIINGPIYFNTSESLDTSYRNILTKLPKFTYEINEINGDKRTALQKVFDFTKEFEAVLKSKNLDIDTHWQRLLPYTMGKDTRSLVNRFINNTKPENLPVKWKTIKNAIVQKYGRMPHEAYNLMCELEFKRNDDIDAFIETFNSLKRRAKIVDNGELVRRFATALFPALFKDLFIYFF